MTPLVERSLEVTAKNLSVSTAEALEAAVEAIPLRRANDPEDIAAMAVFLASPGARNITGQAYNVDGGLILS